MPGSIEEPFGYRVEILPDLSRLRYKRDVLSDTYNLSTLCKKKS